MVEVLFETLDLLTPLVQVSGQFDGLAAGWLGGFNGIDLFKFFYLLWQCDEPDFESCFLFTLFLVFIRRHYVCLIGPLVSRGFLDDRCPKFHLSFLFFYHFFLGQFWQKITQKGIRCYASIIIKIYFRGTID